MNLLDYLWPLQRKIVGMVRRGVVTSTNDGTKAQGVQVRVGDGVIRGPIEYLQQYGFTSQANAGADVILLQVGGSADLPVCIVVSDRRGRVKVLPGESAQWDDQGQIIAIRRGGIVLDAAGRPDGIKLGAGASLGVARKTDAVDAGTTMAAWLELATAKLTALPGGPMPTLADFGTITGGSATVTAGD